MIITITILTSHVIDILWNTTPLFENSQYSPQSCKIFEKRKHLIIHVKYHSKYSVYTSLSCFNCKNGILVFSIKKCLCLQQLVHVNIIGYLGAFEFDSQLHIVLELAEAGDLATLIKHFRKAKRLIHEKTVWKYFVQISAAINYMHSKRIMHRGRNSYIRCFYRKTLCD